MPKEQNDAQTPFIQFAALWVGFIRSLVLALVLSIGFAGQGLAQGSPVALKREVAVVRLNLRTGPSISPRGRTTATGTTQVRSDGRDDERWYEVETGDGLPGWLYAVYVNTGAAVTEPEAMTSAVPHGNANCNGREPVAAARAQSGQAPDGVPGATTVPARMNVRGGPGNHRPVVVSVAAGTTFEIVGLNPGSTWYQVRRAGS